MGTLRTEHWGKWGKRENELCFMGNLVVIFCQLFNLQIVLLKVFLEQKL